MSPVPRIPPPRDERPRSVPLPPPDDEPVVAFWIALAIALVAFWTLVGSVTVYALGLR